MTRVAPAERPSAAVPDVVAPPPGHPRFPLMDSLRALAALGVIATHAFVFTRFAQHHWWGAVPANLSVGVPIFFVLSGFLLYRPFFSSDVSRAPRPAVLDFARRRLLRIVPAYWLALTVLAIYPGLTGVFSHDWWKYYGFLQVYSGETARGGIGIAWTLCIEVSFYAVLPLYALATRRAFARLGLRRRVHAQLVLLLALSVASVLLRVADQSTSMQISLPTHFYWFAVGMALAVLSVDLAERPRGSRPLEAVSTRPGLCWGLAILLYLVMCAGLSSAPQHLFYSVKQEIWLHLLSGTIAGLVVLPAVFGPREAGAVRRVLDWRPLAWLGLISYGLYLWHATIALDLVEHGVQRWWTLLLATFAIATACATVSYYLVERPILRFKYRRPRLPTGPIGSSRSDRVGAAAP